MSVFTSHLVCARGGRYHPPPGETPYIEARRFSDYRAVKEPVQKTEPTSPARPVEFYIRFMLANQAGAPLSWNLVWIRSG